MLAVKWCGGILAALIVGSIGWSAGMLFTLSHRADVVEYTLRFRGMWMGP